MIRVERSTGTALLVADAARAEIKVNPARRAVRVAAPAPAGAYDPAGTAAAAVAAHEAATDPHPQYLRPGLHYTKAQGVVVTASGTAWQEVARVTTPDLPAGTYFAGFALSYTFPTVNDSAEFGFSWDGGTTWASYSREAKDTADAIPFYYAFPLERPDGPETAILRARKTGGNAVLTVTFADVFIEYKGRPA